MASNHQLPTHNGDTSGLRWVPDWRRADFPRACGYDLRGLAQRPIAGDFGWSRWGAIAMAVHPPPGKTDKFWRGKVIFFWGDHYLWSSFVWGLFTETSMTKQEILCSRSCYICVNFAGFVPSFPSVPAVSDRWRGGYMVVPGHCWSRCCWTYQGQRVIIG